MKLKVVVHEAEEGGFWAEVPAIPGCATQGASSRERAWTDRRDRGVKPISGRDLARILERRGWELMRVNGSHHIFGRTGDIVRLSVPIHAGKMLKTGLLRHLRAHPERS